MDTKNMIRVGRVSSVNPKNATARVTFKTLDGLVSEELPVITRGTLKDKDYWLPDVNEHVLCVFLPNVSGRGVCTGFILGAYYTPTDAPSENSTEVSAIKFADGTEVRHDRANGNLSIYAAGNITITAKGNITIDGANVYINE